MSALPQVSAVPKAYALLEQATQDANFTMGSDARVGALLKTLAGTKPGGSFLELGTGTGLSTAWILDGMDAGARLVSVDHDPGVLRIAAEFLGADPRLSLVCADGGEWLGQNSSARFDFIFADSWHGKYLLLEETLRLLNRGGLYVIDDMLPQQNWPVGHDVKAANLLQMLSKKDNLSVARLDWSTGVVVAAKKG